MLYLSLLFSALTPSCAQVPAIFICMSLVSPYPNVKSYTSKKWALSDLLKWQSHYGSLEIKTSDIGQACTYMHSLLRLGIGRACNHILVLSASQNHSVSVQSSFVFPNSCLPLLCAARYKQTNCNACVFGKGYSWISSGSAEKSKGKPKEIWIEPSAYAYNKILSCTSNPSSDCLLSIECLICTLL